MNLQLVEEAFLEDLYDERSKLCVELPPHGFVLYAVPQSSPKSVWQIHLASEVVAEVYAKPPICISKIDRLIQAVRVHNVSSANVRKSLLEGPPVRIVRGEDDARAQMIRHIIDWIGENFGAASRPIAEKLARDALTLVRARQSLTEARELAARAQRWFPTFYKILNKELDRAMES